MEPIRPIRTESDYNAALAEVARLENAEPGSPEFDRLDILATLIEAYETVHYPIGLPDPVDAILFAMERKNLTVKDIAVHFGSVNRVTAVLNRERRLTLPVIHRLANALDIPLAILAQSYPLVPRNRKMRQDNAISVTG